MSQPENKMTKEEFFAGMDEHGPQFFIDVNDKVIEEYRPHYPNTTAGINQFLQDVEPTQQRLMGWLVEYCKLRREGGET